LKPAQQGQPLGQVTAPAGVHLQGVAGAGHLGEDGSYLLLVPVQGEGEAVPLDIAQGIDDVGQTVVAVGAFGHQGPGVVQAVLHTVAGQGKVPGVVGVVQVDVVPLSQPV